VLAGTGKFEGCTGKSDKDICSIDVCSNLRLALKEKKNIFLDDTYIGYIPSKKGAKNFLYITGCKNISDLEKNLIQIFSTNLSIAFENINLARDIVDTQKDVILALGEVIGSLSMGTNNHVKRVAGYAEVIAKKYGLDSFEQELLKVASPMHDLGKIGIPDSILNKKEALTEDEYKTIKKHSGIGYDILKKSQRDILIAASIMAQQHHERWDGGGYPQGLKGKEIHIFGRIICLSDVFDALIHKRPYKEAWNIDKVKDYIKKERGLHFDPDIVDIFLENIEDFVMISKKYAEDNEKSN
jgi:HD-GYP domain-containing protein (c-di-GMP phosphodiesterase class II)